MAAPEVKLKKCSNCSRGLQEIAEFINAKERECSTCAKCRKKGKKGDDRPERREAHNLLQNEKRYDIAWRAKQLEERPEEFREKNNKMAKIWKDKNPTYIANWSRKNVNSRLGSIKYAAQIRGIEWNLSDEEAKVMMTSPCIYCKHMDLDVRVNGIDRLDSGKSYCTENCRPCCKNCNYMKGTFDPKTFIEHARKIAECAELFSGVETCGDHKKNLRKSKE
jgi:hypothetical protein